MLLLTGSSSNFLTYFEISKLHNQLNVKPLAVTSFGIVLLLLEILALDFKH